MLNRYAIIPAKPASGASTTGELAEGENGNRGNMLGDIAASETRNDLPEMAKASPTPIEAKPPRPELAESNLPGAPSDPNAIALNFRSSQQHEALDLLSNGMKVTELKDVDRDDLVRNQPEVANGTRYDFFKYNVTKEKALGTKLEQLDQRNETMAPPRAVNAPQRLREEMRKQVDSEGLQETAAESEAFSTFSLHVSDVSFKLALASLMQGQWPEANNVRLEEFVNALDYHDPLPSMDEQISCRIEQATHPFLMQRNVLRIAMRTAANGRAQNTPLRLTLLLDNSGSMERIDRRDTVRKAMETLVQQLKPDDQVTLISFANTPRLLADQMTGANAGNLVPLLEGLPSEGGTNIEAALQLAMEKALEQKTAQAQNRVVLLTDGAVNLGDADPESLSKWVIRMRDAGLAFDAAGISAQDLNDSVLEALTRQGDGRYYLLDSVESANSGFANQIAGALRPSAKNVKVQVEFNPQRVGQYKLLGFEKHLLKQEDFRNDQVDAAEMAAAEAGVAMYQFEPKPEGLGDIGSVSVRFQDLETGQMVEKRWPIPYEPSAPRIDQASPSLRMATAAVLFAATLRGEPLGEFVDLKALTAMVSNLPESLNQNERVEQLRVMIARARQLRGE